MKRKIPFDLQMFAGKKISDIAIKELSLIFGEHKGEQWSPVNGEALVLTTKGIPEGKQPGFLQKLLLKLKGMTYPTDGPVSSPVTDGVDNDGDGQNDYNSIIALVGQMYYDLQNATWISLDSARNGAVCQIVDQFLNQLDDIRKPDDEKAGKRHSKEDMAHLGTIAAHAAGIGDALKALGADAVDNGANSDNAGNVDGDVEETDDEEKARSIVEAAKASEEIGEDGLPTHYTVEIEGKARTCKALTYDKLIVSAKADKKKSEEPYGDVEYADPGYQDDKKKRYPLDSEKHVRAAWSYINMPKNASKYSEGDLKKVKAAILAACKKYGIETDDQKDDKGGIAPGADVQALVDAAVANMKAALETETQMKIDAVKAEQATQIASLQGELTTTKGKLTEAETKITAMAQEAMRPTSPGFTPTITENGTTIDPAADSNKAAAQERLGQIQTGAAKAGSIGEVIKLQRAAHG